QKGDVEKALEGKEHESPGGSKVKAVGPSDYYRAPKALSASAPADQLVQRLADLGFMSAANQSKIETLTTPKGRYDAALSSMLAKATTNDWTAIQNLK